MQVADAAFDGRIRAVRLAAPAMCAGGCFAKKANLTTDNDSWAEGPAPSNAKSRRTILFCDEITKSPSF